ncbi:S9 family peptidase [Salinimicrobium sp. GXAS 041]|uniref:S9 family peptidase n=1 Tax=Salinimicrobium sp. GXAS 041 TaxID=3400806 RepID=UPI003C70A7B0
MFKNVILATLFLGFASAAAQEKKIISHEDYDLWKRIENTQLSKDGDLVVTTVSTATDRGDGYIKIFNAASGRSFTFQNGYRTNISSDGKYVFFLRKPAYELTRQEKKEDVKEEKRTKDDFFIFDVREHRLLDSVMRVKKYEIPEETTGWVVLEKHQDLKPEKDSTASKESEEKDTLAGKKPENLALEADYALVYNLKKQAADTIFRIKDFELPKEGDKFIFSTTKGKDKGDIGVFLYDVRRNEKKVLDSSRYAFSRLAIDNEAEQMAFLAAKDSTETDSLKFELFYTRGEQIKQITDTLGRNLRENWELSNAQTPSFSENGKRLFFHSRPVRKFNTDTTLLDDEVPQVDVWSYHDKLIQPEQKSRLKELEDKAYISFYNTADDNVIHLHDETLDYVLFDQQQEQRYVLGYTNAAYEVERSWEYPWLKDFYIVDTQNGEKRLALEGISSNPDLSPDGEHAVYYDQENQSWWSLNLKTNAKQNLTGNLPVNFYNEENDVPASPRPYGFGGFTKDGKALFYDEFDIWSASLSGGKAPVNITRTGRENNIKYRTLKLDRENRDLVTSYDGDLLLTGFNETDKSESLYKLNPRNSRINAVVENNEYSIGSVEKAEDANTLVFTKQNFETYPDLHLIERPGKQPVKLTDVNPQQSNFKWGTVELVNWEAYDGTALEGLLYKPEDFEPNKKYPLITYFYEKRSDNLNRYYSPLPSASTVNMTYLVSNDYLVFVPDIVYKEGKPGESAYNAIVSGVEALEEFDYVDSENMAIQGQSWGGYQVAHLVTVTNKFKAAMAGAPVSNMTSAYGGIRWQSGLSRAFQYEKTQSRIGKNLWEGLDLYLENSPLFGIPNIETPLLMMHNDADGAVPYYQGIEMFMGMRRLNKPVWLLVYNDEAHNLRKTKNRQDLSIRMMQFFDHYLKGEPAPLWMTEGLPAIMKGKDLRYELDQE